jgi:hypothetical protein
MTTKETTEAAEATANPAALVAQLQQRFDSLGDVAAAVANTRAAREAFIATYHDIQRTIASLQTFPLELADADRKLTTLETSRAEVVAKITEVEKALIASPPWREHPDPRERDRRYAHLDHLRRQLEHLNAGTLLRTPDTCWPRLDVIDARITVVKARIFALRSSIKVAVKEAEQLLAATTVTS